MGDWPVGDSQRAFYQTSSAVSPNPTANTFGAWAEISSSIPYDVGLWDCHVYVQNALVDGVLDVGLGGAGSESAIVSLPINQQDALEPFFVLPHILPAGQRLSCRCKMNMASAGDVFPDFHFLSGQSFADSAPRQWASTYGLTNSSGVLVSSGSTSGYGAYTEIVASTTTRIKQMNVCIQPNTSQGLGTVVLMNLEIGIGGTTGAGNAAAAILFDQLYVYYPSSGLNPVPNSIGPLPCDVPSGSRLTARVKTVNNGGVTSIQVAVIGVT